MKKHQGGFTLAELTIVIVVLGILSAFIVPKYGQLIVDARKAKVERLAGTFREAAAIAHSVQIAEQLAPTTTVDMDGGDASTGQVDMAFRYPTAVSIVDAVDTFTGAGSDTSFFGTEPGQFDQQGNQFVLVGTTTDCYVEYNAPLAIGLAPEIDVAISGCE